MRARFDEHGLMITAAVSAGYKTIEQVAEKLSKDRNKIIFT